MEDGRPIGARVTMDMIGSRTEAIEIAWEERDAMLYALGVGAGLGDPARELRFTTENSEGVSLRAVPSFLTVLAYAQPPALAELDIGRFLHAGQRIEWDRPLPPAGRGVVDTELVEVLDKGANAILIYLTTLRGEDAQVIGRLRTTVVIRGAGGFGGPRGASSSAAILERAADTRIVQTSRPEQALLYRLSGDRHRLHSDPAFAAAQGFDRPILHGLCTFGFACRALVEGAADGEPDRLRAMEARFSRPVYPGDTLVTEIWRVTETDFAFRMAIECGDVVLEAGTATIAG